MPPDLPPDLRRATEPEAPPPVEPIEQLATVETPAVEVVTRTGAMLQAEDWLAVFSQLPLEGMLRSLCSQLVLRHIGESELHFDLNPEHAGILSDKHRERFELLLNSHLQSSYRVVIAAGVAESETPAARAARLHAEAVKAAEQEVLASSTGLALTKMFDARLVAGSVQLEQITEEQK